MPEDKTSEITIRDPQNVQVSFATDVLGTGFWNGIINCTLGCRMFTPRGTEVDHDLVISSRLRMDVACAMQLRDQLSNLIAAAQPMAPGEKAN